MKTKQKERMTLEEFGENELPHLSGIIDFGNNQQTSIYADTTGVKSPEVVFRGMTFSKNRLLSEEYLLNYKRSPADLGVVIGVNNFKMPGAVGALTASKLKYKEHELIKLPKVKMLKEQIGAVIRSRRSIRAYSGKPMSIEDLSTILFYAQGKSGELETDFPRTKTLGEYRNIELRNAPSGGGLYPVYTYFIAWNISGLEKGVYLYVPQYHALQAVKKLDDNYDVKDAAEFGDVDARNCNFVIFYAYRLYDNSRKYGDLGMALAFLETGGISQNVHLTCTAIGKRSCDIGGFNKFELQKLIEADGLTDHVIHMTVIGS